MAHVELSGRGYFISFEREFNSKSGGAFFDYEKAVVYYKKGGSFPFIYGGKELPMKDSVYKVVELVGTSTESWEKATASVIEMASHTLKELRVAEVSEQDVHIENGKITAYRVKLKVSFKYLPD